MKKAQGADAIRALPQRMTKDEAIDVLIRDFALFDALDQWEDVIRDEVKHDPGFSGLSEDHPRVQQYRAVVRTLKAEMEQ